MGRRKFYIGYHCDDDGSPHNVDECSCEDVDKKEIHKYKPHDELMTYYLSYLIESDQIRIRDEDSGDDSCDGLAGLFDWPYYLTM